MNTFVLPVKKRACLSMLASFFCLVAFTGCDLNDLFSPQSSKAKKKNEEQKNTSADPTNDLMTAGERFAFHRWLVTEMQEQIFSKPARPSKEVDGWANVLSQRGSIEGVYHGFVLSSEYGELEKGRADIKVLRFFSQEMAALDHPNLNDSAEQVVAARSKYAQENSAQSLFALKRILGERVLQESVARKADKERLAGWYASFAARWAKHGVSFGMAQRNKEDEAFHYRWAQENNLGMIQWELLNRVHRVMNSFGGLPPVPVAAPPAMPSPPAGKPQSNSPSPNQPGK